MSIEELIKEAYNTGKVDGWMECENQKMNVRKGSEERMIHKIIDTVCKHFEISKECLSVPGKKWDKFHARRICMMLLKENTKLSLEDIGDIFNRHHTTVISAIESLKKDMGRYFKYEQDYLIIKQSI